MITREQLVAILGTNAAGLYCWLEECHEEGSIMLAASPEHKA